MAVVYHLLDTAHIRSIVMFASTENYMEPDPEEETHQVLSLNMGPSILSRIFRDAPAERKALTALSKLIREEGEKYGIQVASEKSVIDPDQGPVIDFLGLKFTLTV